jgi:hypothetical protein
MWGAIVAALGSSFGSLFVKEVQHLGDRRRHSKRLTPIGYLTLLAALTIAATLGIERQTRAMADELAWRTTVNKNLELTPKVLQRVDHVERQYDNVQETMERHELYLRALLIGQGKDPDRVARRKRLGASEGDED